MNKNKELVINMSASILAYVINFAISFFLSPYIVKNVGVDAYGFVGLANNFISYATLITIAVNAMASRFVTIKLCEKDYDGANKYFSSVFIANTFLATVMGVAFIAIWLFLEKLINIPQNIFWDVKILFAMLFLNCVLSTMCSIFSVATFATNKLYLASIRSIESHALKALIVVPLFILFAPRVSFLGVSTLLCGIYVIVFNIYYTKKLLPDIKIRKKHFDFKAIKELVASGVWSLINRVGQLLLDGLDLLITNLFINPIAMGVLSLAKTIPSIMNGIIGSTVSVFSPNFTFLYAEKKQDELVLSVKRSMRIMGVIANLPVIVLIVCGELFFSLWQPTQNSAELHLLSVLTCGTIIFSGGINCIYNIFTVVNKLKVNSLVVVGSGALNALIVFILLKTTSLGIYAVAGVSTVLSIIRNLAFTAPYGARCLKLKWYAFYPDIARPVIFVIISVAIGYVIKQFVTFSGWLGLIAQAALIGAIAVFIGLFIMLSKAERKIVLSKFKRGKH